ncbi:MAG TPA: tRNA lysidine(34) synthetase TilS [Crocinitomix sp.]|nr:tRNA lysidine(34) synthetase TilS [Crocinitomix sp.]
MLRHIKTFINTYHLTNKTIYLACSGGVDSMVLSHCLQKLNLKHTLLHCNFKLRGKDSDKDENFIVEYAKKHKIEYHIKTFNTKQYCNTNHLTIQEGARVLRYDWFKEFLKAENTALFTAHHLDDQIETFFINLLRGTGLKGLTGIPNQKNKIYRPLLNISKNDILIFAKDKNIAYKEDQSNLSDKYLRNRLRHQHIPNLKKETNNFNSKMNHLFEELNDIDNYLEQQISNLNSILKQNKSIDIKHIFNLPNFLTVRLFAFYNLNRKKINEFNKFLQSQTGSVFKTSTHIFLKDRDKIVIQNKSAQFESDNESIIIHQIPIEKNINQQTYKLSIIEVKDQIKFEPNAAFIDADKIKFPIIIRKWKKGDKVQPLGMRGKKLVSNILNDKKINLFDKNKQLVFESDKEIFWLVDNVVSEKFKITPQTKRILFIEHIKY